MNENPATKVCSKCGRELPIENFRKNPKAKDGYLNTCRECMSATMKEAYAKKNGIEPSEPANEPKPEVKNEETVQSFHTPPFITDQAMVDELRRRGWDVKCTKVVEL